MKAFKFILVIALMGAAFAAGLVVRGRSGPVTSAAGGSGRKSALLGRSDAPGLPLRQARHRAGLRHDARTRLRRRWRGPPMVLNGAQRVLLLPRPEGAVVSSQRARSESRDRERARADLCGGDARLDLAAPSRIPLETPADDRREVRGRRRRARDARQSAPSARSTVRRDARRATSTRASTAGSRRSSSTSRATSCKQGRADADHLQPGDAGLAAGAPARGAGARPDARRTRWPRPREHGESLFEAAQAAAASCGT